MAGNIDWIATPMGYAFMVRGVGLADRGHGVRGVGTFVVLRGMAFLGDASLSHAILPGMAVGYLVGGGDRGPLFWWALGTGVATSLAIGAVTPPRADSRGRGHRGDLCGHVRPGHYHYFDGCAAIRWT
jgi:manganese/iron transport system permease protein